MCKLGACRFRRFCSMYSYFMCLFVILSFLSYSSFGQNVERKKKGKAAFSDQINLKNQRLRHKIVPLESPVYQFLDYCEATGKIGMLPEARPYTKIYVTDMLQNLLRKASSLDETDKDVIAAYLADLSRESNGFQLHRQTTKNAYALIGLGAEAKFGSGIGDNSSYTTSMIAKPYISGDLGDAVTFSAAFGVAMERLAPDLFYGSYVKDGQVFFPNQSIGYSCLPYQFNYETLYPHIYMEERSFGEPNVTPRISEAMLYYTEMNAYLLDGLIQVSVNNQRRAWGHDDHNLFLSSTARRFPGVELKLKPASWLNYSMITGSLFSYTSQQTDYMKDVYGYDLGQLENLFTLQILEYSPLKWFKLSATASTIWWKRFELSYFMPMAFTSFSQIESGGYDNQSIGFDVAFKIPEVGKTWFSFYSDQFDLTQSGPLFRMADNHYAWQAGLKTGLLSNILPGSFTTLKYTKLSPFVYTQATESRVNAYTNRAFNMSYTHDGFNLGFYLPPNSSELNLTFVNVAIPDLILTLDNKLIIHGTNDLSNVSPNLIYGDVNRYQTGGSEPTFLSDFKHDGIYDYTVMSEFKFDLKIRNGGGLNYFRLVGSAGFAGTWWNPNSSGVVSPGSKALFSGNLGVIIDI